MIDIGDNMEKMPDKIEKLKEIEDAKYHLYMNREITARQYGKAVRDLEIAIREENEVSKMRNM